MKLLILFFTVLFLTSSCSNKRNKLNNNEQELAAQISNAEKEILKAKSSKQVSKSVRDTFPPGFRFQEERSVDPQNPPIHLDVLGTQKNIRDIKLSDVASSIQYIKLEAPDDPSIHWAHPDFDASDFSIFSDDKNIFVTWLFGLARFNMKGNFQELVWKSESGIKSGKYGFRWSPGELYGISPLNPVSTFNNNLYIRFTDSRNNQIRFVKQKVKSQNVLTMPSKDYEEQVDTIAGKKIFTINNSVRDRSFETIFGLSENSWAGMQNTLKSAESGSVMTVFSNTGDTLCMFSSAHQVKNRTNPLVADSKSFTWYFKNRLTFLEQYSDTIFRIIPPNRLLPVYLLDFGKDKVSFKEGINLKADLSQKLLPYSIFETEDYLFIRYTRNSAGYKNIKNKTVRFYNAIFDKRDNQFYHSSDQTLRPKNMVNDLDGGLPFWPEFVTPEGKMFMTISGKMLKEHIATTEFKNAEITDEQRQNQVQMANTLNESDKIVIVVH